MSRLLMPVLRAAEPVRAPYRTRAKKPSAATLPSRQYKPHWPDWALSDAEYLMRRHMLTPYGAAVYLATSPARRDTR